MSKAKQHWCSSHLPCCLFYSRCVNLVWPDLAAADKNHQDILWCLRALLSLTALLGQCGQSGSSLANSTADEPGCCYLQTLLQFEICHIQPKIGSCAPVVPQSATFCSISGLTWEHQHLFSFLESVLSSVLLAMFFPAMRD